MKTRLTAVAIMAVAGTGMVAAQDYPNKPIRIIDSVAGGGVDIIMRIIAQGISGPLGQPVIVENHPAALSAEIGAKAQPDGYSLTAASTNFWIGPLLEPKSYDFLRDFAPISKLVSSPLILVTSPELPINSVAELVAFAKAKPGTVNYVTGSTGGTGHLTGELFKAMAGINIVRVPYKNSVLSLPDLMSGRVHMAFDNPSTLIPLIKTGKLRALAVTSLTPSKLLPGLPTVAATVPGYEYISTSAVLLAPAKTPRAIINRVNQEVVRFLQTAEAQEKFATTLEDAAGSSPEELGAFLKSEIAKWSKVITDAGIKMN